MTPRSIAQPSAGSFDQTLILTSMLDAVQNGDPDGALPAIRDPYVLTRRNFCEHFRDPELP